MKIKHINEVRGNELIQLRPFKSIDDLKRINGIADGRIKNIKAEDMACVE
jgi:competence protein ComEC